MKKTAANKSLTLSRRKLLRKVRNMTGLSLEELASRCGLSKSMLSKFELGHRELSPEAFQRLTSEMKRILAEGHSASTKKARPTAFDEQWEQVVEKVKAGAREKEIFDNFWRLAQEADNKRKGVIEILKIIRDHVPEPVNLPPNEISHLNKWLVAEEAASHAQTVARTYTRFSTDQEATRLLTELLGPEEKEN